jgi:hypothetical protein
MLWSAYRAQLLSKQNLLYRNQIRLISESTETQVIYGTPEDVTVEAVHWAGYGSIQYRRMVGQNPRMMDSAGTYEYPITVVCYVPYDARPNEGMVLVDVDGVLGQVNGHYRQVRAPANVGGADVNWEIYLAVPVNDAG